VKIILVGYRACGKTSVAEYLGELFSVNFLDMDHEIVKKNGPIEKIVAQKGWPFFRKLEKQLLQELSLAENLILSTGGGAVLHQDIWPGLKKNSFVVWLTASPDVICQRLAGDLDSASQRPSLTDMGLLPEVKTVLKEREPLYRKSSHFKVNTESHSPPEIAEIIKSHWEAANDKK
jgi:shikimate kinase